MENRVTCDLYPEFRQEKQLICVEYPGIVKNPEKMLKNLGGIKNIVKTHRDEKRLALHFRPDDPCCHSVCGDRVPVSALLLKVRKYRRKAIPGQTTDTEEIRFVPEIYGIIKTCYRFNSMCDFQYLPLHNDTENQKLENMIPNLGVGTKQVDFSLYTRKAPLFLPPATFSRVDNPQDVMFKSYPKYKNHTQRAQNKIGVLRPRRSHNALYLKFEDEGTPQNPLPGADAYLKKCYKSEPQLCEGVKKMFEERPIWSKNAITAVLNCSVNHLKYILPAFAYYFITGPWRSLWVKFGYDPRKDRNSVTYQLLDFRIRQGLNTPNIPIKAKRSTLSYNLPNLSQKTQSRTEISLEDAVPKPAEPKEKLGNDTELESRYIFKPGVLPAYRQTLYQLCDIRHPDATELLEPFMRSMGPGPPCHPKSGWLPEDMAPQLRDILSKDVKETLGITGEIFSVSNKSMARKRRVGLITQESGDDSDNLSNDEYILEEVEAGPSSYEPGETEDSAATSSFQEKNQMETDEVLPDGLSDNEDEDPDLFGGDNDLEEMTDFLEDFDAFPEDLQDDLNEEEMEGLT